MKVYCIFNTMDEPMSLESIWDTQEAAIAFIDAEKGAVLEGVFQLEEWNINEIMGYKSANILVEGSG